jgi:hypothetical protein
MYYYYKVAGLFQAEKQIEKKPEKLKESDKSKFEECSGQHS